MRTARHRQGRSAEDLLCGAPAPAPVVLARLGRRRVGARAAAHRRPGRRAKPHGVGLRREIGDVGPRRNSRKPALAAGLAAVVPVPADWRVTPSNTAEAGLALSATGAAHQACEAEARHLALHMQPASAKVQGAAVSPAPARRADALADRCVAVTPDAAASDAVCHAFNRTRAGCGKHEHGEPVVEHHPVERDLVLRVSGYSR